MDDPEQYDVFWVAKSADQAGFGQESYAAFRNVQKPGKSPLDSESGERFGTDALFSVDEFQSGQLLVGFDVLGLGASNHFGGKTRPRCGLVPA